MVNVIVQHCQGKWESVTACREFQTEEATMPSDVESRQPREGFTWASIQGGHLDSLLYTLCCTLHHHALPVSLLRGQGKPRALSKHRVVRQCQRMTNFSQTFCVAGGGELPLLPLPAFAFLPTVPSAWCKLLCICTVTSVVGFATAAAVIQQTYGNEKEYISAIKETSP